MTAQVGKVGCECPLCKPDKWGVGRWELAPEPLPLGQPLALLYPVHSDGERAWYVMRERSGA